MKLAKWLWVPACALILSLPGCSGRDNEVIVAPQQTEQEIADADASYDEQYAAENENYE